MSRCGVSILWGGCVGVADGSCRGICVMSHLCDVLRGMGGDECGMGWRVSYVVEVVVGV